MDPSSLSGSAPGISGTEIKLLPEFKHAEHLDTFLACFFLGGGLHFLQRFVWVILKR